MVVEKTKTNFLLPFDEVHGDVYGLPSIQDLSYKYNIDKWPEELKYFIDNNAIDMITVATYKDWDAYNKDRALQFVKIWNLLFDKYIGPITLDYVDHAMDLEVSTPDFNMFEEFADKKDLKNTGDVNDLVDEICNYILKHENMNYDSIAAKAEDTEAVKRHYTIPLQQLLDEFTFIPEPKSIDELENYAPNADNTAFVWVVDTPGQQKLKFEDADEAELPSSIIDKFSGYIIDELSELNKLEYAKTCSIDELAKFIKWEDVFFHLAKDQANTNPNFYSWRAKAAHNIDNHMTDAEDQYFWDLNDARHLTLAKQVAKEVQSRLKDITESIKETNIQIDKDVLAIISESEPTDVDKAILKELKSYEQILIEEIQDNVPFLAEIAENNGYKAYGGRDYGNTALVINVKGRPNLDLDALGLKYDDDYDRVNAAINTFASQLEDEFSDFTIRGRMGGYWGLANLENNLAISEDGFMALKDEVKKLLTDPTLRYKEGFDEASTFDEFASVAEDCIIADSTMIANKLLEDSSYITIDPDFLVRMQELVDAINAEEKAMQSKEYWNVEESKQVDKDVLAVLSEDESNSIVLRDIKNSKCYKAITPLPAYYADDSDRPANDPTGYITFKAGTEFVVISLDFGIRIAIYDEDKGRNIDYKVPEYEVDNILVEQIDNIDYSKYANKKSDSDRWIDAYYAGHRW